MEKRLYRVGFHAEKRPAVRDPGFRALSPKVQETFSGTSYETLRRIHDEVSVEDMRAELDRVWRARVDPDELTARRNFRKNENPGTA